jgi:hypothetical protein
MTRSWERKKKKKRWKGRSKNEGEDWVAWSGEEKSTTLISWTLQQIV